jgi:hypothetical protein
MKYGVARVTVYWYTMCLCLYVSPACTLLAAAAGLVLACGYYGRYGLLAALQLECRLQSEVADSCLIHQ